VADAIPRCSSSTITPYVREGLRTFLELKDGIAVVGEGRKARRPSARAEALKPDVVLMDLVMPRPGTASARCASYAAACPRRA